MWCRNEKNANETKNIIKRRGTEKEACGQYDVSFIVDLVFIRIHNT
jgi:hypothetical protein